MIFEITGPDGATFEIEAPNEKAGLEAFRKMTGTKAPEAPKAAAEPAVAPTSINDVVRSTATGVPILGGLANQLNAATNATIAPLVEPFLEKGPETLDQPTWNERRKRSLELQEAKDKKFAKEHPVVDTVAKVAGGVGGTIPAVLAAPKAFGVTGTLPQQVVRGGTSGAALSAADAAVRGEDVGEAAAVGGAMGAGAPLIAKGVGKVVEKFRPPTPPVVQNTTRVGDVDVPLRPDQVTPDAAASAEAELTLRGGRGDRAQAVATEFDTAQRDALQRASDDLAAKLDPTGTVLKTAPGEAGERVATELADAEARRVAAEAAATRNAAAEADRLRTMGGTVDPATGQPVRVADSPYAAGETIGAGVTRARDARQATTKQAYDAVREEPGAFDPEMVAGLSGGIRQRIAADPGLIVNPQSAPNTTRAIELLDSQSGLGLFGNRAAAPAGPVGPVAGARAAAEAPPAPAVRTEAQEAYEALVASGAAPEKARAAVRNLEGGAALGGRAVPVGVEFRNEGAGTFTVRRDGKEIGRANVADDGAGSHLTSVNIAPEHQKQGIGSALYDFIESDLGRKLSPSPTYQTDGARALWDRRGGTLAAHEVATADGKSVRVVPKVVEASAVRTSADEGYPQALQPRNRGRAASDMQVQDMSRNLSPNRLGVSTEADRGAPIIGPDGLVESGNGRTLAIRQAYAEGGEAAARYRQWLADQGVDVSKYREPILVRERATQMTPEQRKAFTVSANQGATLSMSAPERALADSRILTADVLSLIRDPSDIAAAGNRDFVRAFMNGIPATERAALMNAKGELSAEGVTRMRNAVLGKAYGDTPVLTRIAESTNDEVRSISNALVSAAPEWAQMRARIHAGEVPANLDVTGDLVDAVSRTARIRGRGQSLSDSAAQADAFSKQSPESEALQRMFYDADGRKAAQAPRIAEGLNHYAREAQKVDASPGLMLGLPDVTAADILKGAAAKAGAPAALAKEVTEAAAAAPAARGPAIGEVSLREMDEARKRLVALFGDAKRAALAPGGSPNDMRAMGRVLKEFDDAIIEAFDNGRFSGNSDVARNLLRDARASHAIYRENFSSRGPSDPIGRAVEKILGRYGDTRATADEIAALSYGSAAEPGGGKAAQVGQRLRTILGNTSPEWAAYKQGLVSHIIDTPAGKAPLSQSAMADRIERFLDGTKGRVLAEAVLDRSERDALRSYARNLRASEPVDVAALGSPEKIIAKISGRDGGVPMAPGEVADLLLGKSMRTNKKLAVPVAAILKRDLSPESWTALRQGMWSRITNAGEGRPQWEAAMLARRISEFLDLDVAKQFYSQAERDQMRQLASVYRQTVPPKGATNPSGTAPMLARIANRASNNVLAMLGGVQGGFAGLAMGHAADRTARAVMDRRNARAATTAFYGQQPRVAARSPKSVIVLGQASGQAANQ